MDELLAWRKEFPILETSTCLISNSLGAMPVGGPRAHGCVHRIVGCPAAIRRLKPHEVTDLALYLGSNAAAGISGTALEIGLGSTAR